MQTNLWFVVHVVLDSSSSFLYKPKGTTLWQPCGVCDREKYRGHLMMMKISMGRVVGCEANILSPMFSAVKMSRSRPYCTPLCTAGVNRTHIYECICWVKISEKWNHLWFIKQKVWSGDIGTALYSEGLVGPCTCDFVHVLFYLKLYYVNRESEITVWLMGLR